jgi:hypothetical protein
MRIFKQQQLYRICSRRFLRLSDEWTAGMLGRMSQDRERDGRSRAGVLDTPLTLRILTLVE